MGEIVALIVLTLFLISPFVLMGPALMELLLGWDFSRAREEEPLSYPDDADEATVEFILDYTREAPNLQLADSDKLDTKMSNVFAVATVAIGLASRIPADEANQVGPLYLFNMGPVDLFFYLALVAYGVTIVAVITHLRTKKHRRSLQADTLWPEHRSKSVIQLQRLVAKDISRAYSHNRAILDRKSKTVNCVVWATGLEGLFIVAALIVSR